MSVLKLLEKKQLAPEDAESSEEDSSQPEDSYESEGEEEEKEESAFKEPSQKQWKNRSRVLITAGRGHAPGFKTVVRDIIDLLPHSKKEVCFHLLIPIVKSEQKDSNRRCIRTL